MKNQFKSISLGKLLVVSAMMFATPALAGSTPWIDRDNAGGKGDYETTQDIMKIQCRIRGTKQPVGNNIPSAGYYKHRSSGCWCINSEVPGKRCKDIQIKYRW